MTSRPPIDETLPDVVKNFLRTGKKLENITLHANGRWTHQGAFFENQKIVRLFSKSIDRTEGGTWVLKVGQFTYPIDIEDVGFFVTHLDMSKTPTSITISDGTTEMLDAQSISYKGDGRLYCAIKHGAFQARFLRAPYHSLSDRIEESHGVIILRLDKHTIPLSTLEDAPLDALSEK